MKPSTEGYLLKDSSSLKPIYTNPQAIEVFSYPQEPPPSQRCFAAMPRPVSPCPPYLRGE